MNREYIEQQYNNRARVPSHPIIFERWARQAGGARGTPGLRTDLRYGEQPRQTFDFLPAPAGGNQLLVFIHGGYWRALSKDDFTWVALPFVNHGIHVALLNYRLCPEVGIGDIVADCVAGIRAAVALARETAPTLRVVISGHSAGGHLTAMMLCQSATALGLQPGELCGAVSISGVMDLAPLIDFSFNSDLKLTAESAAELSPIHRTPQIAVPLISAVGSDESEEFLRQASAIVPAWPGLRCEYWPVAGTHHFTVVDAFADPAAPLNRRTLALFAA